MGKVMQDICAKHPNIKVYSFVTEEGSHAECSRVISKLRDVNTDHQEFMYYSQRAYEMLFRMAYTDQHSDKKGHMVVQTPVTFPVQNYAVHKIPDIDHKIENSVMCVMLRGALLPSMIMSKEIQEYSSHDYKTPFALFKISRNDSKNEDDMEYFWTEKYNAFQGDQGVNICGGIYPEGKFASLIDVSLEHEEDKIRLSFGSTLQSDACENSFGISALKIYIR